MVSHMNEKRQFCFVRTATPLTFTNASGNQTASIKCSSKPRITSTSFTGRSFLPFTVSKPSMDSRTVIKASTEDEPVFDNKAAKAAEIQEVIEGLNGFKERIIDDATIMAKKLKTSQKALKEALAVHPDILKIDETVKNLEKELNELEASN